ncbi:uncharacterized protein [Dermacentor andersoni]|uniref:uncharacterized protein n=1 Tax=Dermacentor andersoni TaxID=34620 RepID=UPI002155436C|nr:uncharacterized protein LOC126529484 [Dermacentor andersoni]XP_054925770.1 uncharacterized protein LOC126529484 [Dermacentor andersoni]
MISAMPAVAVRRERRRSKSGRGLGSRQGSVASLPHRPDSLSTLNSQPNGGAAARRWRERGGTIQEQRARVLIYLATLLLVAGLILLFIGVGGSMTHTRTVGLLFIAVGALLCLVKLFITPEHHQTIVRRARLVSSRESLYVAPAVKSVPEETLEQVRRETQEQAAGATAAATTTTSPRMDARHPPLQPHNSNSGSSPAHSLHAAETQGLISERGVPLADGRF